MAGTSRLAYDAAARQLSRFSSRWQWTLAGRGSVVSHRVFKPRSLAVPGFGGNCGRLHR